MDGRPCDLEIRTAGARVGGPGDRIRMHRVSRHRAGCGSKRRYGRQGGADRPSAGPAGKHAHHPDRSTRRPRCDPGRRAAPRPGQNARPVARPPPPGGPARPPPGEPRRAQDNPPGPWGGVHTGADSSTDLLASGIAAELGRLTGRDPYLVVARFARKYIDANRPPELGLEDPRARPYYDYYQHSIRRFVDEIRANYPAGLLIDVHGQAKDPDVIMRGTLNGRAV